MQGRRGEDRGQGKAAVPAGLLHGCVEPMERGRRREVAARRSWREVR
jgi:hypothetical protein